jgi:hypothetical protein
MLMEVPQTERVERSWFMESVTELGQFAARLGRNFLRALIISEAFSVVVALVVLLATRGGPGWRAPVAFGLIFIASTVIAFLISVKVAVVLALAETVREKGLAKRTLDGLFAELLGVTAEKPEGDLGLTQSLHNVDVDELRAKLLRAGEKLLERPIAHVLPRFIKWLARKAQQAVVWATIWVMIRYATRKSDASRKVDLLALRASLTEVVDDLVTEKITLGAIRFGLLMALAVSVGAWALVQALLRFAR